MPSWKDLFSNTDRRFFPEVVVPLARDPNSVTLESNANANANAEKKDTPSDHPPAYRSESSPDRSSLQEKGVAAVPASASGELTLESLRAEVEAGVVVSGHDSIYDRTS
jgi:hypothetical protein